MSPARNSLAALLLLVTAAGLPVANASAQLSPWWMDQVPAVLFVTPEGNGNTLAEIGSVLHMQFVDELGWPVVDHPVHCILSAFLGTGAYMAGDFLPDHPTDANGQTVYSGGFAGGGWTQEGIYIWMTGCPLTWAIELGTVPIHFNSPDINADGVVDLADLSQFALDFKTGYHFRSDFVHDYLLNLADLGRFALHYGERRP